MSVLDEFPSNEPDYVVIRGGDDALDGIWLDRIEHIARPLIDLGFPVLIDLTASGLHPTGEFEHRADGTVAEVWTVKP